MNLFRFFLPGIFGFLAFAGAVQAAETDPARAAQHFYDTLRAQRVEGLPKDKVLDDLVPLMTPELVQLIQEAARIQAVFIKNNPDEKPPWIEGDLFGSLFEGAQQHTIGNALAKEGWAEVPVTMVYSSGGESVRWTDTLILRRSPQGWLVDDVRYGGDWPFAAKGTLVEALRPEDS